MNKRIKKIAKKSGFVFYSKKENPNTPIDWSTDYSEEFESYTKKLLIEFSKFISEDLSETQKNKISEKIKSFINNT